MQIYRTSLYLIRISIDILILIAVFIISAAVSEPGFNFLRNTNAQLLLLSLIIVWTFSARSFGLYHVRRTSTKNSDREM